MAIIDIRAMHSGRMDPSGEALTWVGFAIGILATILFLSMMFLQFVQ
jgi:hypothetical protein